MKVRTSLLTVYLCLLLAPGGNSQGSAINSCKRLIATVSWTTFDELLTTDFTGITANGSVLTKTDLVRRAKNGILNTDDLIENIVEKNFGSVSVVTYKRTSKTRTETILTWHTQVYIFRNNQWLLTNSQVTQIQ